ncbi:MAG: DUF1289 domain-containing protein [Paracoccaceae bacterium]
MGKVPSPCIDVCKYKLKGHCIGCGMTKPQKKAFKALSGRSEKRAFLQTLVAQHRALGDRFKGWATAYRRKCAKKDVPCPLDEMKAEA